MSETIRKGLPFGIPHHAESVLYRQAGVGEPVHETDVEQATRIVSILGSEPWHVPEHLKVAAYDAQRQKNLDPLVDALSKCRRPQPPSQ